MFSRKKKIEVDPSDRRQSERRDLSTPATLYLPGGDITTIDLTSISTSGFLANSTAEIPLGMLVRVAFSSGRARHVRLVRKTGFEHAFEFISPLDPEQMAEIGTA